MFKLESYITPIILNHVAKYVKNIRPQDSQVSLWEGEVAFQNLDLRLDVLEDELQLPFEFLSGHIHELTIHVPWTKITSEPINITINTIEFVLKLKDQNTEPSQANQERKKKPSKVEETQPGGYIPSLVNKIINNIAINCHNIILKYVEDDIVVSMNIQLLSFSSADENWQNAFADINPVKMVLRKLVQVADLTICLDKRNEMGQIEVCQEPILYKCSLEIRILRKYNAATVGTTSTTMIHIFSKALDINISSLQFPMAMRLVALVMALKSGELKSVHDMDVISEHMEDNDGTTGNDQSYISWAWNLLPNILSAEEVLEEDESSEGHFLDIGTYIEELKLTLKSSEFISESIVQTTKKIRYNPILRIVLKGIFSETLISNPKWFSTQAGVTSILIEPLGNFGNDPAIPFILTQTEWTKSYLTESLFDEMSRENTRTSKKYVTDFNAHVAKFKPSYLHYKGPAIAFDMAHHLEEKFSESGNNSDIKNSPEKLLIRVLLSSTKFSLNAALYSIIDAVQELITSYNYPPYIEEKKVDPTPIKLPPPSMDEYDALMNSEIPKRRIELILSNIIFELHPKNTPSKSEQFQKTLTDSQKSLLPWLEIKLEKIVSAWETPIDPNSLVFTTCQLPTKPQELLNACYDTYTFTIKNANLYLCDLSGMDCILKIPHAAANFGKIIQPDLWTKPDDVKYKLDAKIDTVIITFNRPQLILCSYIPPIITDYNYDRLIEILGSTANRDVHESMNANIEHTLSIINVTGQQFSDILCCSGSIKYAQSCVFITGKFIDSVKSFIFRAPVDVPLSTDVSFCNLYVQLPNDFKNVSLRPIVAAKISDFLLIIDPALIEFLNYDEVVMENNMWQASSTSVDIVNQLEKPSTEKASVTADRSRKAANPEETVHLSSEKEEKVEIQTHESNSKIETKFSMHESFPLKNIMLNIDINHGFVYIPTESEFLTTITTMEINLANNIIDYVTIMLPHIKIKSSISETFETLISAQCHRVKSSLKGNVKDTFPWTCELRNMDISTNLNEKQTIILHPIKTNVTVALNNKKISGKSEILAFNIHVDTAPVHVELSEKQTKFLFERISFLMEMLSLMSQWRRDPVMVFKNEINILISETDNVELQEFLHTKTESERSETSLPGSKKDEKDKPKTEISCWLQWTVAKLTVDLISNLNSPAKLRFEIEDFITSIDKQSEYFKLKNKIGTMSLRLFKILEKGGWSPDNNIKLTVQSEASQKSDTFFDLTITQAETISVFNKLGSQKNAQNLHKSLTEIVVNMKAIDFLLDLDSFALFIPLLNAFGSRKKTMEKTSNAPLSVADMPLIYFQSKGITVYVPAVTTEDRHNVFIFKIGDIKISPNVENPLNRIIIRADVYNKAAQLRMLHTPGSKVEDRQYEVVFNDISAATGNWEEILSFLNKENEENFQNTNPAVEWNQQKGVKPLPELRDIFSDFIVSVTYAPCIVYNHVLICGQAIELNCVTDLVVTVTNGQVVLFANILAFVQNCQRLMNCPIKESKLELILEESSTILVGPFAPRKGTENIENNGKKKSENNFKKSQLQENEKNYSKAGVSDVSNATAFYPDSGIGMASVYASGRDADGNPNFDNITPSENQREKRIPSEISFVAGVFVFKLMFNYSRKNKIKPINEKDIDVTFTPLLLCTLNQPSMLISQKFYESFTQLSLFNINVSLSKNSSKSSENDQVLFESQPGPERLTGITPPLLWIKITDSIFGNIQIDCNLLKPTVINISRTTLEKLFKVLLVLEEALLQAPSVEAISENKIVRCKSIDKIRKMMFNASRINISVEKIIAKAEEKDLYFIHLSFNDLRFQVNIIDRPEKLIVKTTCGAVSIQLEDKFIVHPINLSVDVKLIQEPWYKDLLIVCCVKFNVIHVDLSPANITSLLRAEKYYNELYLHCVNEWDQMLLSSQEILKADTFTGSESIELIQMPKPIKERCTKSKEEFYQDDLRAGAFQFVLVDSDSELPMPYQIQIILKNNGIICWRYPQPRRVTRLQIYPIPMDTNKPLHIRCRMEYYSDGHQNFLPFCDFHISETETNIVDIPQRKIAANIWRVVILQSFIIVDGQCFECACSSDEDEELNSIKIEDILKSSKDETDFRLNPKALVACMRVDTTFNPKIVPKVQAVIDFNLIQLNMQNQTDSTATEMPYPLQKYKLAKNFLDNHTFATLTLSNLKLYGAILSEKEYAGDINFTISYKVLDYSYLNMLYFLEETNIKLQVDFSNLINVNTTIDAIKINFGPTIVQTLMVSMDHWERSLDPSVKKYPVLCRYLVCNRTNINLMFGQVDTKEKLNIKSKEIRMYCFRSDYNDQKLVFGLVLKGKVFIRSDPICVDEEGVQHVRIAEYVLIIKIKKLSTTQICIFIRGQVDVISMASENFRIHIHYSENNEKIPDVETSIESKERISFCTKVLRETDLNIKLKCSTSKGWTGEIPLRVNKNLPWLVKVPQGSSGTEEYLSYWVRVIRENINDVASHDFKPQRILLIIWPMFMIRSMLASPVQVTESTTKETFDLIGRGEAINLGVPGNHETEHKIIFSKDFVSPHGEDKTVTNLTFKTIDWNKFFWYDEKYWTVERILSELSNEQKINWPYTLEEELKISRLTPDNERTTPIYSCQPSQDFSCSLMLNVSTWAFFINSLGTPIEIRDYSGNDDILKLNSNCISSLFVVKEAFTLCVQHGSSWACSDPVYIYKSKPCDDRNKSSGYFIDETGKILINLKYGVYVSKLLLNSVMENGYRIFTLSPLFVIANFSKYPFKVFSFCIAEHEHIKRCMIYNITLEHYKIVLNNVKKSHKGITLDSFYDFNAKFKPRTLSTPFLFFVCLKLDKNSDVSLPIPINKPLNRKCISLLLDNKSIPLAACVLENKGQFFLSIYDDPCPAVSITNNTNLSFFIAQPESLDAIKDTKVVSDSDKNFSDWYQILRPQSQVFYTPPEMYRTFPDIEAHFAKLALALISDSEDVFANEDNIRWSKPIRTDISTEKYFSVPFHGDVKVIVCDKHKTVRICIFYTTHKTVFCVKDLRSRLTSTSAGSNALLFPGDVANTVNKEISKSSSDSSSIEQCDQSEESLKDLSKNNTSLITITECIHKSEQRESQLINVNFFVKEINLNIFVDSKEKRCLKTEIFSIYVDDLIMQYNGSTRKFDFILSNLQIDNQLFSTGNYDFPVILCPEAIYKRIPIMPAIHNLQNEIDKSYKKNPLVLIRIKLYDEEFDMESIRCRVNPIRAYIEDTYLNDIFDHLIECNPESIIYIAKRKDQRESLEEGVILLPMDVVNQMLYLSEPLRLKCIRIDPMSILISVHTCVRLYIALDHSPLEFSAYEKKNIVTLPVKLGHALGMHYLSGALFGAGWVVGSLEILGSPSGLARSFSIGLRDFVSMPVQGLLRGPWGFIVGITQGSASLLRNVTAGTVNSVTKLAASVARNLDRLTLDDEHFQRTEALRRSRPQGFTQGLSQGLTGFGISLLGAVGGFARHTLEAKSPVQVVTGVGKGIVGAFAKPISGAAELLALTGQGMLHTVGFNAMPKQRFPAVTRNSAVHSADCKIAKLLPSTISTDQILFFHEATLVSGDQLKRAIIFMTKALFAVLDIEKNELADVLPIDKIEASFDENDKTLINLHVHSSFDDAVGEEISFTNQRIMNYLKSSELSRSSFDELSDPGEYMRKTKLNWSFYISEHLGEHLLNYLKFITKQSKTTEKSKF